jgi:hypothetical protein
MKKNNHATRPRLVPTLTEVVAWPDEEANPPVATPPDVPVLLETLDDATPVAPLTKSPPPHLTQEQLIQQVLNEVLHQINFDFEHRLRESLIPLLARATDQLMADAKLELAATLRQMVADAVNSTQKPLFP